ncbi:glycosyltransferase [Geminocystis herdmanii]|uniref:glycosyltransferase n=1 Tax=Geminocystis herdmanii TaxID=669359 RepID=UPI00034D9849|nr:glycosyltransferase [Geminocystis herdmanii]
MIFVTVGTEQFPFNRLMHWIEVLLESEMIDEEIIVQYGNCTVLPTGAKVYRFVKEDMFRSLINQARLVISHCGEGTLLLLDSLDKPYILVSRSQKFKEHVDDHQIELAMAMEQMNIPVAWCPGDLIRFISNPRQVSISDVTSQSAIALCQSLEQRFASVN